MLSFLALSVVWLSAAIYKATDFVGFTAIVRSHAVLPDFVADRLAGVPAVEAALGLLLAACIAVNPCWNRLVLLLSAAVTVVLGAYLAMLPPETLRRAGCGCGVPALTTHGNTHTVHAVVLTALLLTHAAAWWAGSRKGLLSDGHPTR